MRELIESYITADNDITKIVCTFILELEHGWMFSPEELLNCPKGAS